MVALQIGSVIIATHDKTRLRQFYHDILGIPFNTEGKLVSRGVILHPMSHSAVTGPSTEPFRIMLTFDVTDIHQAVADLKAKGVHFVREPEREHWGGWLATFCDPDGNYLQLLQPAPE